MPPSTINILLDNDVFFSALNQTHKHYTRARPWLNKAKAAGWGIAIETYLAAVRMFMNPAIMGANTQTAAAAINLVELELSGPHPGDVLHSTARPSAAILGRATGHKQIMDYWLVQLARQSGCKLATLDAGTLANWPADTLRIP